MLQTIAPSDYVEFFHVNAPASKTGTVTSTGRLDVAPYEYLLSIVSVGTTVDGMVLTPIAYDEPTGGTGIRLDGTNGTPDLRQTYSATDDNKANVVQIRAADVPGRYLSLEAAIGAGGATNFVCVYLGFMRNSTARGDFSTLQTKVDMT